ncbi:hypothetical protein PENSPDRAFT_754714 [Peniophora sp. CONT]|nr:hypothetical protein PENSPDRAFT_754714 [Peniophora sp. CONT]
MIVASYVAANPADVPERIYSQAARSIGEFFIADTAAAVDAFRTSWTSFELQRLCDIVPFAGPLTTKDELLSSFAFWVHAIRILFNPGNEMSIYEPRYREAVADTGLFEIFQDIILWPRFFSQIHLFKRDVFMILAFLGENCPDHRRDSRLRSRAPAIWAHMWKHRLDIEWWGLEAVSSNREKEDGDKGLMESAILLLMHRYRTWCRSTWLTATHAPCIIVYLMATYELPAPDFMQTALKDMTGDLFPITRGPTRPDKVDVLLQEAIVNTVGLDTAFSRIGGILRDKSHSTPDILTACRNLMVLFCGRRNVEIMPFVNQHELLTLFIADILDSRLEDGSALPALAMDVLYMFHAATVYHIEKYMMVTRGQDAVAFLATCIDTIISGRRAILPRDFDSMTVASLMQYDSLAGALQKTANSERSANTIREGMVAGARAHWYSTLVRLREAKHPRPSSWSILSSAWKGLGPILGLDPKQERLRHAEEARSGCSWRNCPRRGQTVTDDKPAVKKCAGCGETRYCSRECQSRDWKRGGHKARCKRLKN